MSKIGGFASEEVVVSLLVSKCLPCLLYGVEACPFLTRNKRSFDFTSTRTLMKLFRTGSPSIVKQCQQHFNVLPLQYQVDIRTDKFLEHFIESTNSVCMLFQQQARSRLHDLFDVYHASSIYDLCSKIDDSFYDS